MQQLKQELKTIKNIFTPKIVSEGVGALVTRIIGGKELNKLDPFLLLDYFKAKLPGGFPDHPHRGFETVTYEQEGEFLHEDFMGHKGVIQAGDIQWMTAGKGICHAEMPGSFDQLSIGFQLWVNLESKFKFIDPAYQEINKDKLPIIKKNGFTVKLIAGESLGQKGPIFTRTPAYYLDVKMEKNSKFIQNIPSYWNSLVFIYKGEGLFSENQTNGKEKQTIVFNNEIADTLIVETKNYICEFILIAGKPINEPIFQHGPFVLSNQQDLEQAFSDYQNGKNGFENALKWESKIKNLANKKN